MKVQDFLTVIGATMEFDLSSANPDVSVKKLTLKPLTLGDLKTLERKYGKIDFENLSVLSTAISLASVEPRLSEEQVDTLIDAQMMNSPVFVAMRLFLSGAKPSVIIKATEAAQRKLEEIEASAGDLTKLSQIARS